MSILLFALQYICNRVSAKLPGLPTGAFETREERPGTPIISLCLCPCFNSFFTLALKQAIFSLQHNAPICYWNPTISSVSALGLGQCFLLGVVS